MFNKNNSRYRINRMSSVNIQYCYTNFLLTRWLKRSVWPSMINIWFIEAWILLNIQSKISLKVASKPKLKFSWWHQTWGDICLSDFLLDSFPQALELLDPVLLPLLCVAGGQGELSEPLRLRRRQGRAGPRGVPHYHWAQPLGGGHQVTRVVTRGVTRPVMTLWLSRIQTRPENIVRI